MTCCFILTIIGALLGLLVLGLFGYLLFNVIRYLRSAEYESYRLDPTRRR